MSEENALKGHFVKSPERTDLDERAANHYRRHRGETPPRLKDGDTIGTVTGFPSFDTFTVVGFHAGGMLVDVVRHADTQEFSLPRWQDPGGWLRAVPDGR